MSRPPDTRKLTGIEAGRGVAATVVVLYHAARHLDHVYGVPSLMSVFQFGHAGVDLFFAISGFIILFVHYGDIGRPEGLGRYVRRRFTRILPTYWVALGLTICLGLVGGHAFPPIIEVVWSAALLPSYKEPLLGVAWTLQFEIIFYAVFCLLIFNRRLGLVTFSLWSAWIGLAALGIGIGRGVPESLYGIYNLEFFLGMGAAYWLKNHPLPAPRLILATGAALFVAAAVAEDCNIFDGYTNLARLIYGLPAAMIVLGSVEADRRNLVAVPMILRKLGAASYSTYLFQFIFIGIAWKLWLALGLDRTMPEMASFPLLAAAGIAGGIAVSRWIEYPLMGWIRRSRRANPDQLPPININA